MICFELYCSDAGMDASSNLVYLHIWPFPISHGNDLEFHIGTQISSALASTSCSSFGDLHPADVAIQVLH